MSPHVLLFGVPVTIRPTALVAGVLSALGVALVTREHRAALSAAAGAPMDGVDFGLYPKSVYVDHDVSPAQHIGRASGGLVASLVAALALAALARAITAPLPRRLLTIAAVQHGLLFAASMLPTRLVDGGVIYANLPKLRR